MQLNAELQIGLQELLSLGRTAGADFVEFFLEQRHHASALVENGKVTGVNPSLGLGAGVRLFRGQADCYVSTNDVTFAGLKRSLEKALDILGLKFEEHSLKKEVVLEPLRDYGALKQKNGWLAQLSPLRAVCDVLLDCNEQQKKFTAHVQSVTSSAFYDLQEVLVAASDGVFARDVRLNSSLSLQSVCVDGAHRAACHKRVGDTANAQFFTSTSLNGEELARELAEKSRHMLYADYVTSGNYPVVLSNQFGGVIFHEACGHLLETTAVQLKSTPFASRKGQKIAHENLTAIDEGLWPNGFGSLDMDDEGMPTQKTTLIENGVLKNFLCDRAGNLFTQNPRTGSGRKQNHTFAAASRMRNTYIAPGSFRKEDMFASIDKGLYCKSLGGGSVNSTGDFNFAVEEGWWIENGQLTKPVKGAILIGQAPEILQRISMSGSDLELAAGFCGSVSGTVYVTVGQPHIKVDSITVGGR